LSTNGLGAFVGGRGFGHREDQFPAEYEEDQKIKKQIKIL
jgi:hypothetical protein